MYLMQVQMDDCSVKIQEKQSGKLAASGYLRNELYIMNMRVKPAQPAKVYLANVTDTLQVCRSRAFCSSKQASCQANIEKNGYQCC